MSIPALDIASSGANPGDGFLEKSGYTIVYSGWEHDVTSGIRINAPIAKNKDGSEITGVVRSEYIQNNTTTTEDITAPPPYEAVSIHNAGATLTRRVHQVDPKEIIPSTQWAFADCTSRPNGFSMTTRA